MAEIAKENTHNSDVQQQDANDLQSTNVEQFLHHQTVERRDNITRFEQQLKGFMVENEWV